jgi:hypothetical protein
LKLTRIEYSDVVAVMKSRFRLAPPKVKLATVSGHVQLSDPRAVRVEAVQPAGRGARGLPSR